MISAPESTQLASCCANFYEQPLTRLLLGSSFHPGGLSLSKSLARALAVGPGDRVLDVASGRGETAFLLARDYGANVVGLDYSLSQTREAQERAASLGLQKRVSFVQGDANQLPFAEGVFDLVFCECALCTFADGGRAASEMRRVLRPAGVVGFSDVLLNQEAPEELKTALGHVLCISGALTQGGYEALLIDAGFKGIRFRDESSGLLSLIKQMETRVERLGEGALVEEGADFNFAEMKVALSVAHQFVLEGGLAYATFTGKKSR